MALRSQNIYEFAAYMTFKFLGIWELRNKELQEYISWICMN